MKRWWWAIIGIDRFTLVCCVAPFAYLAGVLVYAWA